MPFIDRTPQGFASGHSRISRSSAIAWSQASASRSVQPSVAPIAVRLCKSGIDFDSSVIVCNGSVQLSFGTSYQTAVIVDESIMRIEADGFIEISHGAIQFSVLVSLIAPVSW